MPPPGAQVAPRTLPHDILHAVLHYLSQPELRKAAFASRALREAAKHAGLHIHRNVTWDSARRDVYVGGIQEFLDLVEHAETNDTRISLNLNFQGSTGGSHARRDAADEDRGHIFERLAEGIARALPYLVFLRLTAPDYYRRDLHKQLCHPASHLHKFELCDGGIQLWRRGALLIPLPLDIFSGDAPKLRQLSLQSVPIPPQPPAAFARVTHLRMDFDDILPEIVVAQYFPALDTLRIDYFRDRYGPGPNLSLRGLQLSSLTVDTKDRTIFLPMIHSDLDLALIPAVRFLREESLSDGCAWSPTLSSADRKDLHACITGSLTAADEEEEDVDIVVTLPRAGWRRQFRICEWRLEYPSQLLGEGTGIVTLHIENKFIMGLLERGVALPVLRDLRIDMRPSGKYAAMIWPLEWGLGDLDTVYNVPCPCLETLCIAARGAQMQIEGDEVFQLANALGQAERCAGELARLVLRRVAFESPADLTRLFSDVIHDRNS